MLYNGFGSSLQAAILMTLSCISYSLMQVLVHVTDEIPLAEQVFFRNITGTIVIGLVMWLRGISFYVEKGYRTPVLARAGFGVTGTFLLFYASSHALQADVSLFSKTTSVWTFLILHFMGQKMTRHQFMIVGICLLGAAIAIRPGFNSGILPQVTALAAAMCTGIAYVAIGSSRGHVDPLTIVFYFCLLSTVVAGLIMIPDFKIPSSSLLPALIMIGLSALGGQAFLSFAVQKIPAGAASVYEFLSVIISAILGYIVFTEIPAVTTWIGFVLIAAGSYWNYLESKRKGQENLI